MVSLHELIYDWNRHGATAPELPSKQLELDDETLRDGLQSPSILDPAIEDKLQILHYMDQMQIDACDIGLPGAGPRAYATCLRLAREIGEKKMRIRPNCAVRTVRADVDPLIRIVQEVGYPVEAAMFIGSSPIRLYTEGWTIDKVKGMTEDAVSYATQNDIPVMYVTEDTTRTDPDSIRTLFQTAIAAGAYRVCIADTVGHITPRGVRALIRFIQEVIAETGKAIKIDWHGHSDRGLAMANAIAAIDAGVDRVHATALGIGERCGNTQMDQLLINLRLAGSNQSDLHCLHDYCTSVSRATGFAIPDNYPAFGRDAFRTSTGVHAAAIVKAKARGEDWLADAVYSGVPAALVGCEQQIEVGFMSGASNVAYYLKQRQIDPTDGLIQKILQVAKERSALLDEAEILGIVAEFQSD